MKLKSFIAVVLASLLFTSCGSMSKLLSSTDFTNGSAAGSVIRKLFSEFTNVGSIDFSKAQNILNVASLASSLTSLKGDVSNQTVSDFTQGLIKGSSNLVNTNNSSDVMGILSGLSNLNLSGATNSIETGKTTSTDAASLISGISGLMSLLKK